MLKTLLILSVGYVLGAKAGRDRYDQLTGIAERTATALDKRSKHTAPVSRSGSR